MNPDLKWLEMTLNSQTLILEQLKFIASADPKEKEEYKKWVSRMLSPEIGVDLSDFAKTRGLTSTTIQRWAKGKNAPGGFRRKEVLSEGIIQLKALIKISRAEIVKLKENEKSLPKENTPNQPGVTFLED